MAGDKVVVAMAREVEKDIVLKSRESSRIENYAESPKPSTFETPRASSVETPKGSVKSTSRDRSTPKPRKYVSPMAKAREEKKRREAEDNNSKSKDWPTLSDMESSSNPSSAEGTSVNSEASNDKAGNLPKFGEWDKHGANSGPCYTLLFQNAAQEKKIGGPIRVHANRPDSPARTKDLYEFKPVSVKAQKKKQYSLLCCFNSS